MADTMPRARGALILATLVALGCQDQGFTQLTQQDVFRQNRRQTFDLLVVVDNSCSMVEEQAKLATNFDAFIQYFEGTDVDWQLAVVTTDMEQAQFQGHLIGGDDEIVLVNDEGLQIDRVAYSHDWAVAEGEAYALDPTWFTITGNDSLEHWCKVGAGGPGAVNDATCGGDAGGGPDDSGVLITEFMADPSAVADDAGEWVEVTNLSDVDVDLTGWSLVDEGRNVAAIPDGTTISAGGTLVFGRSADTGLNGGVPVDVALGVDFTLNNDVLVLSGATPGPAEIFAEMVAQGTSGSGAEMGLEAARRAVTEPLVSGANAGFVREEANLNVFVVSDEEDSSPDTVWQYLRDLADVKGEEAYRDHRLMNVSAVVGVDPPEFDGEPSCTSTNGNAVYGSRYVAAVAATGGLDDSICDDDFSPVVSELGLTLSGLEATFELSKVPDLDTLEVALYDAPDAASKVRDLTRDVDFTYEAADNALHFSADQLPDSEQYIVAEYKVQSGGGG